MTPQGCSLVSPQHPRLPVPRPGCIEAHIASLRRPALHQGDTTTCLTQVATKRSSSARWCGALAGNTAVCAQPNTSWGWCLRNPWAKSPSGRPGRPGRSGTLRSTISCPAAGTNIWRASFGFLPSAPPWQHSQPSTQPRRRSVARRHLSAAIEAVSKKSLQSLCCDLP